MTQERCEKFIGKAIVLDPDTGEPAGYEAYVCLFLTGPERQPGVTIREARTLAELLAKLGSDELHAKFKGLKLTFDPPEGDYPICRSLVRQRFEALALDEIYRAQAALAG